MFVQGLFVTGLFVEDLWLGDTDGDGADDTPVADMPPDDLAAVLNGDGTATLTWTDSVADNTGYAVERADGEGDFAEIEADAGDVETYDDTGPLTSGAYYAYRVKVLGGALDGEYSNEVSVGGRFRAEMIARLGSRVRT